MRSPTGQAAGAIPFNRRVFHDVAADRVRGFPPLAGDLIGQFHSDLHDAVNLAQRRRHWQHRSSGRFKTVIHVDKFGQ
jgi:hypothetical protein